MDTTTTTATEPRPDLRSLEPLVGTWRLGEDTAGTVAYTWMDGGFFLLQRVDMALHGHSVSGIEVIGHWRPHGAQPDPEIRSRAYDNTGNTLDYIYELDGATLTIWAGEKPSPVFYRGRFSADGDTVTGAWTYPGGGYRSSMTRIG